MQQDTFINNQCSVWRVVQGCRRMSLVIRGCLKLNLAISLAVTLALILTLTLTLVLTLVLALALAMKVNYGHP